MGWRTLRNKCFDGRIPDDSEVATVRLDKISADCKLAMRRSALALPPLAESALWRADDASSALASKPSSDLARPLAKQISDPTLRDVGAIVAHHWVYIASFLNHSRFKATVTGRLTSPEGAVSLWGEICDTLCHRLEMVRWHLSYHLFEEVFRKTEQDHELPPLVFHKYCCSSAEVIHQIARSTGLLQLDGPAVAANTYQWGATIVEVGVETGTTSRRLLELLPRHVRLVGVDPFIYNTSANLSTDDQWVRQELSPRYGEEWLAEQALKVERIYADAQPAGRARFLNQASPGAASDPLFRARSQDDDKADPAIADAGWGADMVFLDGDHSEEAVARDLEAWLRTICAAKDSEHSGRVPDQLHILAGHDFTFMFPGVLTAVTDLSARLYKSISGNASAGEGDSEGAVGVPIHLASNAVWWIPISVPSACNV